MVACGVVAGVGVAHAGSTPGNFEAGSLIIPTSASFQDDCGALSAYGLVYDVLRAEGYITGTLHHSPIAISYVVSDAKHSPNRCIPSSLSTPPTSDAAWDDGCDFTLSGSGPLVGLVNNAAPSGPDGTINTIDTTHSRKVYPPYASVSLAHASSVGYLGGPFLIENVGTNVTDFLGLLSGTLVANDSQGNPIDFSPFRTPGTCSVGAEHYVNIHRTPTGAPTFSAPVRKVFTAQPPRLAVLETDIGHLTGSIKVSNATAVNLIATGGATESGTTATYTTSVAHGISVGDTITVSGVRGGYGSSAYNGVFVVTGVPSATTFTVTLNTSGLASRGGGRVTVGGDILENYLAAAGLDFTGSQGCPTGGVNLADPNVCPLGGVAGQIFDIFDFQDLVSNQLANQDSGVDRYTVLWTPHWETKQSFGGSAPVAPDTTALANISAFLDHAKGLMGECASIASFEGAYQGGAPEIQAGVLQLQTCPPGGGGGCSGAASTFGINNAFGMFAGTLHNCSDPVVAHFPRSYPGPNCAAFGAPTDEYVQIGDYMWNTGDSSSYVVGFTPLPTASIFKPGVVPLIAQHNAFGLAAYDASRSIKDNAPGKANILYLGGHDQSGNVAGTKLALQTLLLLGDTTVPPVEVTTETSRSTPISFTLPVSNKAVIFTGSFENVQPPEDPPQVNSSSDLTAWKFPFVLGHLRATDDTSITTAGIALGSGTVEFDAGSDGNIPAVSESGCGTYFDGTCRSVFTTTAAPDATTGIALYPARVMIADGAAGTVGPLMVGTSSLGASDYTTLMHRILHGWWNGTTFVAKLGGIDRSTVAVIGPSNLAGSGRATVAYVGAADGMLHAICAEADATKGCPAVGVELWAFLPRSQLPAVRLNTAKIDGSPRVVDAFGSFSASTTKSFHTILTFQTGSGDPTDPTAAQPAIYALDVSDPRNPTVVWEKTIGTVGAGRGADALGVGMAVAAGEIQVGNAPANIVLAETNNGGTNGAADATAGVILFGLNMENGSSMWPSPFIHAYGPPRLGSSSLVPHTGVPGGAVGVDKTGAGFLTDVVFGDLYGEIWQLDVTTGLSRYPTNKPLFSFTHDFQPIGALPAIYSNGGQQFAIVASGGYVDLADVPSWGTGHQQLVVSVALSPIVADVTLNEGSPTADVPFHFSLNGTELAFSQAQVIGGQVFVTTDSTDVNASGYGTTGAATGNMYSSAMSSTPATAVVIAGGATSLTNNGTTLYAAGGAKQQQLATAATSTVGAKVDTFATQKLSRMLWLRTE